MLQCRPAQEFSLGPRALKDALMSTDLALWQLYASTFSPAERLFLDEAYNPQRTLFCVPLIHTAFDWLLSCPEVPKDFETFQATLQAGRQAPTRKHIYLQPIEGSEGPVAGALLDSLRSFAETFFLGLQVRCLPSVATATIHCASQSRDADRLQLHTDGILSFLKNSKPGDMLGVTLSDLYPCEAWSFTFGTFLPGHHVGICSFARFSGDLLQGASRAPGPAQSAADDHKTALWAAGQTMCFSALGMVQCCKVGPRALCHLLGPGSCGWLRCVTQGALSLEEAVRPQDLCPICLGKLQHLLGFRRPRHGVPGGAEPQAECKAWRTNPLKHQALSPRGVIRVTRGPSGDRTAAPAVSSEEGSCPHGPQSPGRSWPSVLTCWSWQQLLRTLAWTQAVEGVWPGQEAGESSELKDTPPSSDSGLGCENDLEPGSSLSEPLTPDVWAPALAKLESEGGLGSLAAPDSLPLAAPEEAVTEHGQWLAMCIQALEREVTEQLARVDGAVDALARWEMFTGRLLGPRRELACGREGAGLCKVLGDKLSSLRKRLSARRLSRPGSAPCRGKVDN
ncbi:LOW QUALITY PROTEIN: archaemetzincin-1 [Rhynchonycteris naso]